MHNIFLLSFLLIFSITFVVALPDDSGGVLTHAEAETNFSLVNVNNSNFLEGYSSDDFILNDTDKGYEYQGRFQVEGGTDTWYVETHDGDTHFHFDYLGGNNYVGWSTAGAFMELYANPNPSNNYKMWGVTETQGADTEMNIYEGGTTHNRLWSSGSVRIGGAENYLCTEITDEVDCDTSQEAGLGSDLIVADDIWNNGTHYTESLDVRETSIFNNNVTIDGVVNITGNSSILGDLLFTASGGSPYLFTTCGGNCLTVQAQDTGQVSHLRLMSADGDGTDNVLMSIHGVGTPDDVANRERLILGYDNDDDDFHIQTESAGTGTDKNLHIFTGSNVDQMTLYPNGNVTINNGSIAHTRIGNLWLCNYTLTANITKSIEDGDC